MISPRAYQKMGQSQGHQILQKAPDGYADEFNGETNYLLKISDKFQQLNKRQAFTTREAL